MRQNKARFTKDSESFDNFRNRHNAAFAAGPRETHKATCADCKRECDVPFKPREGKPVYCRECYPKHRTPR